MARGMEHENKRGKGGPLTVSVSRTPKIRIKNMSSVERKIIDLHVTSGAKRWPMTSKVKPDSTDYDPPDKARPDTTATRLIVEDGQPMSPSVKFKTEELLQWIEYVPCC